MKSYRVFERRVTDWMIANGVSLLRVSIGIVFLWFGALKFFPSSSPAEALASTTMVKLSLGVLGASTAILILAFWETAIGVSLIFGFHLRLGLGLLFFQMAGTLTPLVLFPSLTFQSFPFVPTMEGQYILKNLVLISGAIVVATTIQGARLVALRRRACCSGDALCSRC
jgi:uncharacterized membrane protein YkgB